MIELKDIHKTYRMGDVDVHALNGVSLHIAAGEFVAIMGPSGSGKSTLMHVIGLLDTPNRGQYNLHGQHIDRLSEEALALLRSRSIGFVFQQFNLLPRTSARANVGLPLLYHPSHEAADWPEQLLAQVGLTNRAGHKPNQLSGGQQQRVAIARALVNHPLLILADEPTGNLDSASEKEIMGLFSALNAEGMTVVLVTHESEIAHYARRIIHMRDGKIERDETRASSVLPRSAAKAPSQRQTPQARSAFKMALAYTAQAAKALLANKVRSGLSMLGVLIGVAAVIAMLALGSGAKKSIEQQLASMGSNLLVLRPGSQRTMGVALEAGSVTRFTIDDAQAIATQVPGVRCAAPSVSGRGQAIYGNKNWNTSVQGVGTAFAPMRASVPRFGRFFTEAEVQSRARVAVLGVSVVRELFNDHNPMGELIKINKVSFQVIGVLPEKGASTWRDQDDVILIPISTAMYRLLGKTYVDSIDVEVADATLMAQVQAELENLVRRRHRLPSSDEDSFQIRNMAEIQSALNQTSRTMSLLLSGISAISLLIGGIGIMNILLVSVTERTREIGLRKALGAQRVDILFQFLVESLVISICGGTCGILLGWGASSTMAAMSGWTVLVSVSSVLLAFGFSATVGLVFGLWPALKASRLKPIEALRYE